MDKGNIATDYQSGPKQAPECVNYQNYPSTIHLQDNVMSLHFVSCIYVIKT